MRINLTHAEVERNAYIEGDVDMAKFAALTDDLEDEVLTFDERLDEKFDEGKLEASDAELVAEIKSLKADRDRVQIALNKAHMLIDASCNWLSSDKCKTVKSRDDFRKSLRADQLRVGRS
jgi:hypothetical protein